VNYIDIILIIPFIWFIYKGFTRGLIIELASLAALILGIYGAFYFTDLIEAKLTENLNVKPDYSPVIAFIIIFVIVAVVVYLVGKLLEGIINLVALGLLNKLAGVLFGILKCAVLLSVLIYVINHFNDRLIPGEEKESSLLYRPIEGIVPLIWQGAKNIQSNDRDHKNTADYSSFIVG
jgi:membrane protein required for colicin V production